MLRPTVDGLVAQSVEQRIENPCVGGSIPPRATKLNKHLELISLGACSLMGHFRNQKSGNNEENIYANKTTCQQ
jgi:hypothetical protein